jgi:aminopeptidase N
VLHRVFATKGKAEMGRYALDSSAQVTEYFNDYFGTPYPLPKLDEIAVPGGFGGAMENWGGITYFESRLLFDPERSSSARSRASTRSSRTRSPTSGSAISSRWRGGIISG